MNKLLIIVFVFFGLVVASIGGAYLLTRSSVDRGDNVAVIEVHGVISSQQAEGLFGGQGTTPALIRKQIEKAERDSSVKAILIEVNSPGGTIVASEAIAEAITDAKKPTVAWLGEMAASGGYYVASATDYIVADQGSMTGSIGVIFTFPQYNGMLDKIGVRMRVFKAGKYKDIASPYRNMTPEEEAIVNEWVMSAYDDFIQVVADNRNLSNSYVRSVAEGNIYTGRRAVELDLADRVGTRKEAIKIAAHMGGIEGEPGIVTYRERGFFSDFVGVASTRFGYGFARGLLAAENQGVPRY
ncbi:MAG TPA: signal peptide peptidase SppA [Euryarchaeota archaeon]|nr:putative signal peptide peptidase SppA [archaeon BMS3Abin16]GBE56092.1 putative signal peptide peptidase SppA [archaeon BMS3Bbin16]HDH28179.1 signal peptide peptidase SppA [Euryarchaeota archaeon]